MKKFSHFCFGAVLTSLLVFSCKPDPEPETIDFTTGIFVLNEGNFTWGNASLDFIDAEGELHREVFKNANDAPLGDVAQEITAYGDDLYIVVNNTGKIERVSANDLKVQKTITGLTSPRNLSIFSTEKAYSTDLYADAISIFNPVTGAHTASISTGDWTEDLLTLGNKTFVTHMGTDQILVIDHATDALTDSFWVGREPNSLVEDANGKVWALCSGGLSEAAPRLSRFDPVTHALEATFQFSDSTDSPSDLVVSPAGDQLYFLNGDVFSMDIAATDLPTSAFVEANGRQYYHLEIDPLDGAVYVTDAIDFVQQGRLLKFHANGNLLQEWHTGIIPGDVLFVR